MKLYYSPGACSLAPHIALREANRNFDLDRVDRETHRTASGVDYMLVNPRGSVPALQLDGAGSDVLVEASAVLQYIADLAPEANLAPPNGTFARYHMLSWLSFIAAEVHKELGLLFELDLPERVAAKVRGNISERLIYLEDVLTDRAYLMGERFMICDAYLFAMLQWVDRCHIDLQLYPNIDDYEYRIWQRPAVQAAMRAEGLQGRHHYRKSA